MEYQLKGPIVTCTFGLRLWLSRCRALQHRTPIGLWVVSIYFLKKILSNNITVQYSNKEGILYMKKFFYCI